MRKYAALVKKTCFDCDIGLQSRIATVNQPDFDETFFVFRDGLNMYTQYWQLSTKPFEPFADSQFYCQLNGHHAALQKLRYGLLDRPGFCLLSGSSGVGKTALAQQLIQQAGSQLEQVIWLTQPYFQVQDLLWQLHQELHPEQEYSRSIPHPGQLLEEVKQAVLSSIRPLLIVIDDAQQVKETDSFGLLKSLYEWKMLHSAAQLYNSLEIPSDNSAISVLLLGHPRTVSLLESTPELSGTLSMHVSLPSLSHAELAEYLRLRLRTAGREETCFDDHAVDELFRLSGGVIRRVNQLADLSLLIGFVQRLTIITGSDVLQASQELMLNQAA